MESIGWRQGTARDFRVGRLLKGVGPVVEIRQAIRFGRIEAQQRAKGQPVDDAKPAMARGYELKGGEVGAPNPVRDGSRARPGCRRFLNWFLNHKGPVVFALISAPGIAANFTPVPQRLRKCVRRAARSRNSC